MIDMHIVLYHRITPIILPIKLHVVCELCNTFNELCNIPGLFLTTFFLQFANLLHQLKFIK